LLKKRKPDRSGALPEPELSGETPEQKGRRLALGMLARREHAAHELARKLAQRGLTPEITEPLIEDLRLEGLLSEERFLEQFVRSRIERGDGPVKIRAELTQRGIAGREAEDELERQSPDWIELAERQRRKRFGAAMPVDYAERAKQARFLQGRGFNTADIRRVLKGDLLDDD
jgi:regulatory protein